MKECEKRNIEDKTAEMFKNDINDVEAIAYMLECIRNMCKCEIERDNAMTFGFPSYWKMGLDVCDDGLKTVVRDVKSFIKG